MTRSKSDLSAECTKQYGYCRWHSHTAPAAIKCISALSSLQLTSAYKEKKITGYLHEWFNCSKNLNR